MKIFKLLFLVCCFSLSSAAQNFTAIPIDSKSAPSLSSAFKRYSLYSVNTSEINRYIKSQQQKSVELNLQLPGLTTWNLRLTEDNILHPNYKLVVGGNVSSSRPAITYGGGFNNSSEGMVRLTLTEGFIYGLLQSGGTEYFIEPLRYFFKGAPQDVYVVYEAGDVVPDATLKCGLTETKEKANSLTSGRAASGCVITEIAIAADESMYSKYGSAAAVETHNIGVMNNVQGDYLGQFDNEIHFSIVTQNISTNVSTDQLSPAYTGTNSSTILSNFRTWGQAGNFGVTYDVAQLWTNRNIDADGVGGNSGIVGLAYVNVVCGTYRYHLLQDYAGTLPTGSGYSLRVLTSHEIGHNFSANHDDAGSGFIMAPSINNTTTWSPASIASIDGHVFSRTCLQQCIPQGDCQAVRGLTYSAITNTSATVSWNSLASNTSYDVEYKQAGSSAWVTGATGISGTSVNITGLVQARLYDWRVRPYCSSGVGTYSQGQFATSSTVISCEQCAQVP